MANLGLPPVPSSLRPISPFLQRADELRHKEPVVAYWCAYYAAQVGISLKAKDHASRNMLLELLEALEKMKKDIGPNDAIDMEAASAAYVENFALKVFGMADDEDRRGDSTRSTAKKFLAAANFLEVLKTFPKAEVSESTEEKIRYAKWKAADIARAFREGRKPTPGPAGGEKVDNEYDLSVIPPPSNPVDTLQFANTSPTASSESTSKAPLSSPSSTSPSQISPPSIKRSSPPPVLDHLPPPLPLTPPHSRFSLNSGLLDSASPGNWSTAATPGATVCGTPFENANQSLGSTAWPDSPNPNRKQRSGSDSSTASSGSRGSKPSRIQTESVSPKKVHFLSGPSTELPSATPVFDLSSELAPLPQASVPPPTNTSSFGPTPPSITAPQPRAVFATAPPVIPASDIELTPRVVAKAQKHCRFAISALDYEDAEQAKKELRAALAILGG